MILTGNIIKSCSKLHSQKYFELKHVSYKIRHSATRLLHSTTTLEATQGQINMARTNQTAQKPTGAKAPPSIPQWLMVLEPFRDWEFRLQDSGFWVHGLGIMDMFRV